jgi:hypothetical protein
VIAAILAAAWSYRDSGLLTPGKGAGYWLGIVGAVVLLMLALYPVRKRLRLMHGLGSVAGWFRLHMIFGIIGPTLVILHTNFTLGPMNSRLAVFTMLAVVASGLVGRYLHAHVHQGLYGRHTEVREILSEIERLQGALRSRSPRRPRSSVSLRHLAPPGLPGSLCRARSQTLLLPA